MSGELLIQTCIRTQLTSSQSQSLLDLSYIILIDVLDDSGLFLIAEPL